jgi:hypothetical protein
VEQRTAATDATLGNMISSWSLRCRDPELRATDHAAANVRRRVSASPVRARHRVVAHLRRLVSSGAPGSRLVALGRLAGLLGGSAVLLQLALVSRLPWASCGR